MQFRLLVVCSLFAGACSGLPVASPAKVWVEPVTGMEFLFVPAARFDMGSGSEIVGRQADEDVHEVELTQGFYLGRYEVTQSEWVALMGDNPSQFAQCGPRCPVESVSFVDIQEYTRRLEQRSDGFRFRLPTEAEWEMACRAGTQTPFSTGNTLTTAEANFDGRYPYADTPTGTFAGAPVPVGSYPPNSWGFYDFHGNVWEWCADWYGEYPRGPVSNPPGSDGGSLRVIRGGSWAFNGNSARCALRYTHAPMDDGYSLGFRLVRE